MDVLSSLQHLRDMLKPEVTTVWTFGWERTVYAWVDSHRSPVLGGVLTTLSTLSEWGLIWFVLLAFLYVAGDAAQRKLVLQMLVGLFIGSVCVILPLWHVFPRERPYMVLPGVHPLSLPMHTSSFPSGHVKTAWLITVVMGAHRPRFAPGLILISSLIAYARMYDGMHWPFDVLFGALLGITLGLLILRYRGELDFGTLFRREPGRPRRRSVRVLE